MIAVILGLLTGCVQDALVTCGDQLCPVGDVCVASGCATRDAVKACSALDEGAPCDTPGLVNAFCFGGACHEPLCGNSVIEPGEACDDGNTDFGDGCSARCDSTETCDNGVVDATIGEQCDDAIRGLSLDGCSSRCTAEIDDWRDDSPVIDLDRALVASAYDVERQRGVTFGGENVVVGTTNQTREWDGKNFLQRFPRSSPPPRADSVLAYDEKRHVTVMFGGSNLSSALGDTWEWDGVTWTQITPTTSPGARADAMMAYDPASQRVILFGGTSTNAGPTLNDTWSWDGVTWTELHPAASPSPRYGGAMARDATGIVLAGGRNNSLPTDSWKWNGTTWTLLTTAPTPRVGAAAIYDRARGAVILWGAYPLPAADDTWKWNGTTWTEVTPPNAIGRIGLRRGWTASYDTNGPVVFAGTSADNTRYDGGTFQWDGTKWITLDAPRSPGVRRYYGSSYDPLRGRMLLYGGQDYASGVDYQADLWSWDGHQWEREIAYSAPGFLAYPMMVFDRGRQETLLYGGLSVANGRVTATWKLRGTTWTELPTQTLPHNLSKLVYDDVRDTVIAIGQDSSSTPGLTPVFSWNGSDWTKIDEGGPPLRAASGIAYDRKRHVTMFFGGGSPIDGILHYDTWQWDGTWTEVTNAGGPAGATSVAMIYEERSGRMLLLADGDISAGSPRSYWVWNDAMKRWDALLTSTLPTVSALGSVGDPLRGEIVSFGFVNIDGTKSAVWSFGARSGSVPPDACINVDTDGDGLAGCDDPDCGWRCDPLCRIGTSCTAERPHCGDGACSELEDYLLCPADCDQ